jgi:hypothetical protein
MTDRRSVYREVLTRLALKRGSYGCALPIRISPRAACLALTIGLTVASGCRHHDALRIGSLSVFPSELELALQQLAIQTHLSFGLELQPSQASADIAETGASVNVSGLPAVEAFAKVVDAKGGYRWSEVDGMIVVRPKDSLGGGWLDQRVGRFDAYELTAKDAVYRVHRLFDASYNPTPTSSAVLDRYRQQPAKYASVMKPLNLSLHQATVWQILDAIANAHGGLSWIVRYQGGKVAADHAIVELFSLDKWTIVTRARPIETRNAPASRRPTSRRAVIVNGIRTTSNGPLVADTGKH